MKWKSLALIAAIYMREAGESFKAKDANTTGRDDLIGVSLVYAADLIEAIIADREIPKAPAGLR